MGEVHRFVGDGQQFGEVVYRGRLLSQAALKTCSNVLYRPGMRGLRSMTMVGESTPRKRNRPKRG
jgi:hypothetical protein